MISDPIADMLIRIKNGYQARKEKVLVPYSRLKDQLGQILLKEGFIKGIKVQKSNQLSFLVLELKYEDKKPAVVAVKRISKPGVRIYRGSAAIPRVTLGWGITVVSTSKGLMTDKQARIKKLGGEIICQVW